MKKRPELRSFAAAVALAAASPALGAPGPEVRSDARIELVSLVQQLSGESLLAPGSRPEGLAGRALERFASFKRHPVVRRLARMRAKGYAKVTPSQMALYLGAPPELAEVLPIPEHFAELAGGRGPLEAYLRELRDFAAATGFAAWYEEQRPDRESLEASLRKSLEGRDLAAPLAAYLGLRTWDRWFVVPSDFFPPGGSSSWILEEKPGLPDVYVLLGPRRKDGAPDFGKADAVAEAAWPEAVFSTAYLMIEVFRGTVDAVHGVCGRLGMTQLPAEENCIEDQWVSAVVGRMLGRLWGPEREKAYLGRLPASPYLERLRSVLGEFEKGGAAGPRLVDWTPRLLEPFLEGRPADPGVVLRPERLGESLYKLRLGRYVDARLSEKAEPDVLKMRAQLRAHSGDLAGAEADLRTVLRSSPRDGEAWGYLGVVRARQGDRREALGAFDKALELAPGAGDPGLRADLLSSRAQASLVEAREDLRKSLSVAPPGWSHREETEAMLRGLQGSAP